VNAHQRELLVEKIDRLLSGVRAKKIAVLGLAFKPNTDDVRESPAVFLCRALARQGADVRAFDPVAIAAATALLGDDASRITFAANVDAAVKDAHCLVIMTEWNEFRGLDLDRMRGLMTTPLIVDARNVLDPAQTRASGFQYVGTGRGTVVAPGVMV
jgi:UDPglucose 6-dehydrogenase